MKILQNSAPTPASEKHGSPGIYQNALLFCLLATSISLIAALSLPKGYALACFGDLFQAVLLGAATCLAFLNAKRSRSSLRGFWLLISVGSAMWFANMMIWTTYEVWYGLDVPDMPTGDILLFVKLVPLTAAIALEPHKTSRSKFQAFGLLDVCILTIYSLYLYTFYVFAYRLVPGSLDFYNFHFNVADAIGNQIFALVAGIAMLRTAGPWRRLYSLYFFIAALYCMGSDLGNVAIDSGGYYSGGLFDVPLTAALAGFVAFNWMGRTLTGGTTDRSSRDETVIAADSRLSFVSSHLAMVVTLSIPVIGLWLITWGYASPQLFTVRLISTLVTIFLLTLLLAVKQHLLTETLVGSLQNLSATYARINRFKDHLTQNEKLASLGESVAKIANQIKKAMNIILERAQRITGRPSADPRIESMAGKIGQYAQRTDALVENMLRFAQETSLQLAPLEIKPLLESTLQLGRASKVANVDLLLTQVGDVPKVLGDSSQLLHVFLQLISNAVDALQEAGGGRLEVTIRSFGSELSIEFADSGPGIREPEHVFEPFYTTKPVGKGTGLGLSTCYGIIQQHQGEITCRNRPGGGAVFTVLLPANLPQPISLLDRSPVILEGAR